MTTDDSQASTGGFRNYGPCDKILKLHGLLESLTKISRGEHALMASLARVEFSVI